MNEQPTGNWFWDLVLLLLGGWIPIVFKFLGVIGSLILTVVVVTIFGVGMWLGWFSADTTQSAPKNGTPAATMISREQPQKTQTTTPKNENRKAQLDARRSAIHSAVAAQPERFVYRDRSLASGIVQDWMQVAHKVMGSPKVTISIFSLWRGELAFVIVIFFAFVISDAEGMFVWPIWAAAIYTLIEQVSMLVFVAHRWPIFEFHLVYFLGALLLYATFLVSIAPIAIVRNGVLRLVEN